MTLRSLSRAMALSATFAGAVGAYALVGGSPGVGVPLTALAVATTVLVGDPGALRSRDSIVFGALALILASMAAVRDAEWIIAMDLVAALGLAALAAWNVTTWATVVRAAVVAAVEWVVAPARVLTTLTESVDPAKRRQLLPLLRGSLTGGFLVLVFGTLFVSADSAFARITSELVTPSLDARLLPARAVVGVLTVGWAGGLVLMRTRARHEVDVDAGDPFGSPDTKVERKPRAEWIVPLALLDALFVAFVLVQVTVLFGGREHVVETAGVTYADYARSGFFQLMIVGFLTLAVVAIAIHAARPRGSFENGWLRMLLGILCVCTLVILVSAYQRLELYEETYGFTRLRIAVHGTILWLGAIFTLVIGAGLRMKAGWLPKASIVLTAVGLIAFTVVDPDAVIARENVERFEETGKIDVSYVSELSSDALPHLLRLPAEELTCIVPTFDLRLGFDEPWTSGNLARARARSLLERTADYDFSSCPVSQDPYDYGDDTYP